MTLKSYEELRHILTFEDRFRYLSLVGTVGDATFGSERYLNQRFYTSYEWRSVRDQVIIRDNGCDLGILGREIYGPVYVHHMNPIKPEDLKFGRYSLIDPNNLITVSHRTHNAIHYGDEKQLVPEFVERSPGDTKDW
jgi:hypothetical protein